MKKTSVKMLAEGGIMIALAKVLSLITLFQLPQGGSITLGSMVPLIFFAIKWGVGPGMAVGAIYGVVDSLIGGYVIHPAQFFLDYVLAYSFVGLSGKLLGNDSENFRGYVVSIIFAIFLRFISHVLSGLIFFSQGQPSFSAALKFSVVYNGSFLLVEAIIAIIIVFILWKPIIKNAKH